MHIVKGSVTKIRETDGSIREEVTPDMPFRSGMEMLHWAVAQGWRVFRSVGGASPRRVDDVYLGQMGRDHCHIIDSFCRWKFSVENLDAMRDAQSRLRELLHYLGEVEPEWREVETVNCADNSTERVEENKYGKRRRVMVKYPSGDACF